MSLLGLAHSVGGGSPYLVVAEPDLAVGDGKVDDMIDERFCSPRRLGHRESLQNVDAGPRGENDESEERPKRRYRERGTLGPLTCERTSLMRRRCGSSSNCWSKTTIGREPLRQFPVIFISSIVCALRTWKRTEGPFGVFAAQR